MSAPALHLSSTTSAAEHHNSPASPATHAPLAAGIIAERWPTLARALGRYEQSTAEQFSRSVYDCIDAGLIRLDDRKKLAHQAETLGIRAFDAQLLIACAIRQWALDHQYDPTPSPTAPALSFEYKSWGRAWARVAILFGFAAALDLVIIWKWLS